MVTTTINHTAVRSGRLSFLDAIRGLAALLVVDQHTLEQVWPSFGLFSGTYLSVGRVGVVAFFLVSGFIIPFSLERVGSLKPFWISRFFRLYPLYWFSVVAATTLTLLGPLRRHPVPTHTVVVDFLGNLTMIQRLFHIPGALGLYGTLLAELLFYFSISILFAFGWTRKTLPLLLLVVGAGMVSILPGVPHSKTLFLVAFWSGTFLFGTLIYRYWHQEISRNAFVAGCLLFVGLMAPAHILVLHRNGQPLQTAVSWLAGYALFGTMFWVREFTFPKWLLWVGKISYSVYLVHATLLLSIYWLGKLNGCLVTLVGVIPLSWLTYRMIEEPCIEFGKHLNKRILPEPRKTVAAART